MMPGKKSPVWNTVSTLFGIWVPNKVRKLKFIYYRRARGKTAAPRSWLRWARAVLWDPREGAFSDGMPSGTAGINTIYALGIIPYKRGTEAPFIQYIHFNPRQFHLQFHFLCRAPIPMQSVDGPREGMNACETAWRSLMCMRKWPVSIALLKKI